MARVILTAKRAAWARSREHDGVMRGRRLALPAGVAMRYEQRLTRLVQQMVEETRREIVVLFNHPDIHEHFTKHGQPGATVYAMDVSPSSQARILTNKLKDRFDQLFSDWSKPAAETMVTQANDASKSSVYTSLKELSGGLSLKTDILTGPMQEFFKATITRNVALIKSIPAQYFQQIQESTMRSITDGKGLADLVPDLEKYEGVTRRRAEFIATDQTHKAYNGLNRGRMEAIGVKQFEWVHSGGGQHPRPMHIALSGTICSFAKLPIIDEDGTRGIPGQLPNCRCTMVPVVRFDKGEAET